MTNQHKRFTIEMEHLMRRINQEIINPLIPEVTLKDIEPMMAMTARARAVYLQELLKVAAANTEGLPDISELKKLRLNREIYDELVRATKAMEVAIERGYLDIKM